MALSVYRSAAERRRAAAAAIVGGRSGGDPAAAAALSAAGLGSVPLAGFYEGQLELECLGAAGSSGSSLAGARGGGALQDLRDRLPVGKIRIQF